VIGADVGGIRYTVVDGKTGFLVPPRDPDALADRLSRIARDPALGERLGQAGLERVHASFTWARVARMLEEVYRRVARAPAEDDYLVGERTRRGRSASSAHAAAGRA
jgi:glycosyltransferase involved in cell wall biosynthesis